MGGQAQKEMTHNEALSLIDALLHTTVESGPVDTPPAAPEPGECWIVGDAPTDAFSGQAQALALFTEGGWRFVAAREGMMCRDGITGRSWRYADGSWIDGQIEAASVRIGNRQVVGARQPAIADVAGGATVDGEARSAIGAILAALRTHGLIEG